jgi:hypothetical protein
MTQKHPTWKQNIRNLFSRQTKEQKPTSFQKSDSDLSPASNNKWGLADIDMHTWIKWCVNGTDHPEFERLCDDFRDAVKDDSETYIFNLRKDILFIDLKLSQTATIANHLRQFGRNEELIQVLQGEPYFINLSFANLESDLSRMQAQHKAERTRLKIKESEYVKHIEKYKDNAPPTEEDWHRQLGVLRKWAGYHFKAKDISVMDYIVYLNDFKRDVKHAEQQRNNK